jgi:hypothetical protein
MEQNAPDFDEAWGTKEIFRIPRPQASPRLIEYNNGFRAHMQNFFSKSTDKEAKEAYSENATLKDVQEEAIEALKKYKSDGKSWRHPLQSTGRAFSDVASRFEFLVELLPYGEYTSIACGGLKLAFNAAKRMKSIRESIFKTFDGLSDTIDNTNTFIRAYEDHTLHLRAEDLYVAVLEAVKGITFWLRRNPLAESFKVFFLQNNYGKKLEDKMTTDIQNAATLFEERIKALLHIRVENIDQNVASIKTVVSNIVTDVGDVNKCVASVNQKLIEVVKKEHKMYTFLEDHLNGMVADVDWKIENLQQIVKDGLATLLRNHSTTNMMFMPMAAIPQCTITTQQLLGILDTGLGRPGSYPTESLASIISRDSDLVCCIGGALNPIRQERIATVMQDPDFQYWFKSTHSQTLVINGMEMDADWQDSVSPMSYMCYLLSQTLSRLQSAKSLNFYCGLHSMPDQGVEGVNGMLRSIITQLLLAYGQQINLSFPDFAVIQELQKHNIQQLCLLLGRLLRGFGIGVVFMMIDGVSWFECETRVLEMAMVMQFLNRLVEDIEASKTGFVFKLLITSPIMSQYSKQWFPAVTEVIMHGNALLEGTLQGFDELQMLVAAQNIPNAEDWQYVGYMQS